MSTRILLVDDEPITRIDLKMMLEAHGFEVIGQASDGFDAIELCKKLTPDIVLMDIKMPGVDGLRASEVIKQEGYAKEVILITAFSDDEFVQKAMKNNVYSYVVKPITESSLIPLLQLASKRCGELDELKKKVDTLEDNLATRKIVEKAKGYIIAQNDISEQRAYEYLRKMSMDKRCSMKEIAEAIVKIYE